MAQGAGVQAVVRSVASKKEQSKGWKSVGALLICFVLVTAGYGGWNW